jgi:hypothetical protein
LEINLILKIVAGGVMMSVGSVLLTFPMIGTVIGVFLMLFGLLLIVWDSPNLPLVPS